MTVETLSALTILDIERLSQLGDSDAEPIKQGWEVHRDRALERHERIVELTNQGLTADTIASKLGVHVKTVTRHRSRAGLTQPTSYPSEAEKLRAKQMLADGASYNEVGKTLRRYAGTVARWHPGYQFTAKQRGEASAMGRKFRRLEATKTLLGKV